MAEAGDCDGQGQATGDGHRQGAVGAPATCQDKAAATAVLVMARTGTNVPVASAVTTQARLRSSWWPCRNTTALPPAAGWPD
jgi:hypothetical protein